MRTRTEKGREGRAVASRSSNDGRNATFRFVDHRPAAIQLRELQALANESARVKEAAQTKALIGNRRDDDVAFVHRTAAAGVSGSGHRLPHHDAIQRAFGAHDISHVRAYTGPDVATASQAIGAEAYASGSKIAFADPTPALRTAAHEAAHVIQQQAGVQLSGEVGAAGDRYERHADAVADAVVRGESAEALLDAHAGASSTRGGSPPTQTTTQMAPVVQRNGNEDEIAWPEGGWSKARAGDEFYNSETDKLKLAPLANYPHMTDAGKQALREGKATSVAMTKASADDWKSTGDQPGSIPVKHVALHKDKKVVSVVMQLPRGLIPAMAAFNQGNLKDAQEDDVRHVSTHPWNKGMMHRHTVVTGGADTTIDGEALDTLADALANQGSLNTRQEWEGNQKEQKKATAAETYKALFRETLL
jgi:Domain of unknown function (DUF4157)